MSFLAAFVMRGRLQAALLAFALVFVSLFLHPLFKPFVIIVSFASVALFTLRKGAVEGLYVLLYATVATALFSGLLAGDASFLTIVAFSCLMMWLPIWVLAIVLRESRHLALTIEIAVFMAALGVIGFYLYVENPASFWQQAFEPFIDALPKDAHVDIEKLRGGISELSHYMTGIFAASTLFGLLFSLFLARWWQSLLYNPEGFKAEFLTLRTGGRLAIISIMIIVAAKTTSSTFSELSWNITILAFVLYSFIGTSVVHTLLAKTKLSKYAVPMLYITLFLVPHALLPVASVGLCDAWLNLRKIQPVKQG